MNGDVERSKEEKVAAWVEDDSGSCSVKRETYGAVYHLACFLSVFYVVPFLLLFSRFSFFTSHNTNIQFKMF